MPIVSDTSNCFRCSNAAQRKRDYERFRRQPRPFVTKIRLDRVELNTLYSSYIIGTDDETKFWWSGRENHLLRSSFSLIVTKEQARDILAASRRVTGCPEPIKQKLLYS